VPKLRRFAFSVIAGTVLGLDPVDREVLFVDFETWCQGLFSLPFALPGSPYARALQARQRLLRCLGAVLEKAQNDAAAGAPLAAGGLDLLAGGLDEAGLPLSDVDVTEQLLLLLFAGYETTVVQIWMHAVQLLSDRTRWQALLDDPSLIPKATEELIRASLIGGVGIPRYARDAIDIAGVTIAEGDLVLLDPGSANHDPAFFKDPDVIDFRRTGSQPLSFGYGGRYCLGAPLARMELNSVFSQMIPRFSDMRLAVDVEDLSINSEGLGSGLVALPVTWGGH
jgi:cytochrome P450